MTSHSSGSSPSSTPTYHVSVNERPAFGFIGRMFGFKHQSISFEKTKPDKTKIKVVSIGNPETEPLSAYPTQVRRPVTREQYKALKKSSREERDSYGKQHLYIVDYVGFRGNCNDHVRKSHTISGVPFPDTGLKNQSFYHQPPMTLQQQRRLKMVMKYTFENPYG